MSAKLNILLEMFKNLKSDAVPRPPRPSKKSNKGQPENDENVDSSNDSGITIEEIEDEDIKKEEKPKFKNPFFKSSKKNDSFNPKKDKKQKGNKVYTQATGNVINIVNSRDIQWGNKYFLGQTTMRPNPFQNEEDSEPDLKIKKDNIIVLIMEANIKPQHVYLDYISKNLGKNWRRFFRTLGYRNGRIETCEIDAKHYGVSEARYKLLLDWVKNDEDGTLGRLVKLLWEEGERQMVKDLALMYKKSTQNTDKPL